MKNFLLVLQGILRAILAFTLPVFILAAAFLSRDVPPQERLLMVVFGSLLALSAIAYLTHIYFRPLYFRLGLLVYQQDWPIDSLEAIDFASLPSRIEPESDSLPYIEIRSQGDLTYGLWATQIKSPKHGRRLRPYHPLTQGVLRFEQPPAVLKLAVYLNWSSLMSVVLLCLMLIFFLPSLWLKIVLVGLSVLTRIIKYQREYSRYLKLGNAISYGDYNRSTSAR